MDLAIRLQSQVLQYKRYQNYIMQAQNSEVSKNIKEQFFADPNFIKKSKINYFNCEGKGLHEGEKLVLVCLDPQCKARGLICPVCKEENHKNHEVIHLKVFLGELQAKIIKRPTGQDQEESKNEQFATKTLSQHLQALEAAKKGIITNLQECVKTLAQAVKQIQKKIQDEYVRVRRIILSQKSFESRLPNIYDTLLASSDSNEDKKQEIKQEIKKLTELLQKNPKKDKINVANNADKVVEMYVENSSTCTTHLLGLMTDLPKKISDLPIKLKNIIDSEEGTGKSKSKKIQYVFSQNLKANLVLVSEDKKSVSILGPDEIGGLVFIEGEDPGNSSKRKISLKITSSVSESISIGVGDVEKMKQINFTFQQMENEGLFGICAMGININDIESPTFVFSQGDIIEITFDPHDSKILFGRRNGVEKQEIDIGLSEQEACKLKFFANLLLYGDAVQIVQ